MQNSFGKTSRLLLKTIGTEGGTLLEELSFTAPYKIMAPFEKSNGGISVMPLCASAGIMEGDCQELDFQVGEGSNLEVLSQSFDKIHRMREGQATRMIRAEVKKNSVFYYYPQPVIPFRDSAFESRMDIHLEDETARLFLADIISCGRVASGERFQYRKFASRVEVRRGGKLIYRDHTCFEPGRMPMEEMGMYEGYTHVANLFCTGGIPDMEQKIWDILEQHSEIEGGVSRLAGKDLAVRMFGVRAQKLQTVSDQIKQEYEAALQGPVPASGVWKKFFCTALPLCHQ